MSGLVIRRAEAGDAATLARLIAALLDRHGIAAPAGLEAALARDGFGPRPRFEALLAERAGAAVGMALYYPAWRPSLAAPGLVMEDLYVAPEARRGGVGRALFAALAARARARGCAYVEWTVEAGNETARAFYEATGARPRAGKVSYQIDGAALAALAAEAPDPPG